MHKRTYSIYGIHSIKHALENTLRNPLELYIANKHRDLLQNININLPIYNNNESILITSEMFVESTLDTIISKYNRIILLDGLEDPRNIGSIIRTAAVFGFAVILRNKGCGITETVVQCASGGIDIIDVMVVNQLSNVIKKLKENEFWICGLLDKKQDNYITLDNLSQYNKIVIMIGSEGNGLSQLSLKLCDFTNTIEGNTGFNVLNASNTASILMYALKNNIV